MLHKSYYTLLLLFLGCFSNLYAQTYQVEKGILDLRELDFDEKSYLNLRGDWSFYYGDWLTASQMQQNTRKIYCQVPSVWNGLEQAGKELAGTGIATYHLRVLVNTADKLALKIPPVSTSYELFINGKLHKRAGKIGNTASQSLPDNKFSIVEFSSVSDTLDIVFHVSNFHHKKGGLWKKILLGKHTAIYKARRDSLLIDTFLMGSLLVLCLYHFFFFLLQYKDKTSLLFSLFCLCGVVRLSTIGEMYLTELLPFLSWESAVSIEYISFFMLVVLGASFLKYLYPKQNKPLIIRAIQWIGVLSSLFTLFAPSRYDSHLIPFYQAFSLLVILYLLWVLIRAILGKERGVYFFLGGAVIVLGTAINDILHYNYLINSIELTAFGILSFFVGQAFALARKFSTTFNRVATLSKNLREANQNLEQKVRVRTHTIEEQKEELNSQHQKLIKINHDITASINYAQKIQQSVLVQEPKIRAHFQDLFILYRPKHIVSGDFYWFGETETQVMVAAVDCTGHGIPGAFMSLIGNNLLGEIVNFSKIHRADAILEQLKVRVEEVLKQRETGNQDGMDISLCVLDKRSTSQSRKLQFAGVRLPLIYFQKGKMKVLKGDKVFIGGYHHSQKNNANVQLHEIKLETTTTFYLFSDGYQDQFGGKENRKFSPSRFRKLLGEIHQKPFAEQREALEDSLAHWRNGQAQVDDILVMGFQV